MGVVWALFPLSQFWFLQGCQVARRIHVVLHIVGREICDINIAVDFPFLWLLLFLLAIQSLLNVLFLDFGQVDLVSIAWHRSQADPLRTGTRSGPLIGAHGPTPNYRSASPEGAGDAQLAS